MYSLLFQANGMAAMGQYKGGEGGTASGQSLFVPKHTYLVTASYHVDLTTQKTAIIGTANRETQYT